MGAGMRERKVLRMNAGFWKTRGMAVCILQETEMAWEVIFGCRVIHFMLLLLRWRRSWALWEGSFAMHEVLQVLQCTTPYTLQLRNMKANKTWVSAKNSQLSGRVSVHILEEWKPKLTPSYDRRCSQVPAPIYLSASSLSSADPRPEIQAPTLPTLEYIFNYITP